LITWQILSIKTVTNKGVVPRLKKLNKSPHGRALGTLAALAEGRKKAKGEMNL
jgi:hypothetical protein